MQQNMFQLSGVDLVVPVKGIEGAKAYPLGPNCRAPLFDDSEDILYVKTTDANGFPSIKAYDLSERVLIDENSPSAVSLNDIRQLIREELMNVKEDLINAQQPVPKYDSFAATANGSVASTFKHNGKSNANAANSRGKQSAANTAAVEHSEKQQ